MRTEADTVDGIETVLEEAGTFAGEPDSRRRFAQQLAAQGAAAIDIQEIAAWVEKQGGLESPSRFLVSKLRSREGWMDLLKAIRTTKAGDRDEQERTDNRPGGSVRYCSRRNPYGWTPTSEAGLTATGPGGTLTQDHNEPGEWNPFRQAYNLKPKAARDLGQDGQHRVEGVTRWAALGFGGQPEPHWSPAWDRPVENDPRRGRLFRHLAWDDDAGPQDPPAFVDPGAERIYGE